MAKRAIVYMRIQALLLSLLLLLSQTTFSQKEFYTPKALLIPVHTSARQLHLSLGRGGGFDAHLSYALSKHIAVFATGTRHTGRYRRTGLWGDKYYIEKNDHALKGGFGYFSATGHKLIHQVESYLGYGNYLVDNYWYFPDERGSGGHTTKAKFWNVFWQFQGTYKIENQEATAALRLAYSKYNSLETRNLAHSYIQEKTTMDGLWGLTFDPTVSYSYFVKKFKFNLQAGMSISVNPLITLDETFYQKEGNEVIAIKPPGTIKMRINAPIGRLSIQRNFDFRSRSK